MFGKYGELLPKKRQEGSCTIYKEVEKITYLFLRISIFLKGVWEIAIRQVQDLCIIQLSILNLNS